MTIQTRELDYRDGATVLRAFMAWDDRATAARPGVLVSHAWRGRSDFENDKALALARLGYVGFALDVYGKGKLGASATENAQLMQPFMDDRALLQRRLLLALQTLRLQPEVDRERLAGIGFCFGGLCMLDLARSGADIAGVVSFHGLLGAPEKPSGKPISAKVLVLHGWDDPMATPDSVLALAQELSAARADWQLYAYGDTLHAFMNPLADDPAHGLQHKPRTERRAWLSMQQFLVEIFQ